MRVFAIDYLPIYSYGTVSGICRNVVVMVQIHINCTV